MRERKPRAALGLVRSNVTKFVVRAREIYTGVNSNKVLFVSPSPSLATLLAQIQAVEAAQQLVPGGAPGAAAARDVKIDAVISTLEALRVYVQALADAAPPEQALSIIQAAGMRVRTKRGGKALLTVTPTQPPGTVILRASARALTGGKTSGKTLHWAYSTDGGKTWIESATPRATTTISGLPLTTEIAFRVRASFAKGGESPWSPAVHVVLR